MNPLLILEIQMTDISYAPRITRVEIITNQGRVFTKHNVGNVEIHRQDDGRTLKIFLEGDNDSSTM